MRKGREKKPTRTGPWPVWEKKGRTGAAARRARQRGHRGQAARRWRAHPLGSMRAGEGAGDSAKARSTARSLVVGRSWLH